LEYEVLRYTNAWSTTHAVLPLDFLEAIEMFSFPQAGTNSCRFDLEIIDDWTNYQKFVLVLPSHTCWQAYSGAEWVISYSDPFFAFCWGPELVTVHIRGSLRGDST
jgi:hypothetical protein